MIVDLNCDMGESYGRWALGADEAIMPFVTSVSIACGYHAGDPHVMRKTVALALRHGVAIGAHPSLPDLMGFGRRPMAVTPQELKDLLCYQIGALREFCRVAGTALQHVKPHGALYQMAEEDEALAKAIGEAARESGPDLILLTLGTGRYDAACRRLGIGVASEGFADRAYNPDGTLVSRKLPGSVMSDPAAAADQAVRLAREGKFQTLCCHGDTPGADKIVRAVREGLEKAGIGVRPLREWLGH